MSGQSSKGEAVAQRLVLRARTLRGVLGNNAEGMLRTPRSVWGPLELLVKCQLHGIFSYLIVFPELDIAGDKVPISS